MSRTRHLPPLLVLLLLLLLLPACGSGSADPAAASAGNAATADPDDEAADADSEPQEPTSDTCAAFDPEAWRDVASGTRSDLDEDVFAVAEEGDTCVFVLGTEDTAELGPIRLRVQLPDSGYDQAVSTGEAAEDLTGIGDWATYLSSAPDAPFGAIVIEAGGRTAVVSGIGHRASLEELAGLVAAQL